MSRFSLDYPTAAEQDRQRGPETGVSSMNKPHVAASLGVSVTFIAVMMRSNFDRLAEIADIVKAYDAPLRINVYQSVRSDAFALTYDEYWRDLRHCLPAPMLSRSGSRLVRGHGGVAAAARRLRRRQPYG
jgi:MoaA/NifB/PqqE/SkfB family radical SAM enzyme